MSVNQSGLRRTVGRNELDEIPKGIRTADLIAGAYFIGLNAIGLIGEYSTVFSKYGGPNPGIKFLYKTLCYPAVLALGRFISLKGDTVYVWLMAQLVFILTAFLLWLFILISKSIFKALSI